MVRAPADWLVRLPAGLTLRESMILGTAGFTAAQSVLYLAEKIAPSAGEVVVTGASGGVGSIAVAILAKLGYDVTAVSGKPDAAELLKRLGAQRIVGRDEIMNLGAGNLAARPLLAGRFAGAVDTVGGEMLATLLRATKPHGLVTACGLVGGVNLPLTVFPFILRGVSLVGVDSGWPPRAEREQIWSLLAGQWKPDQLDALAHEIELDQLDGAIEEILAGKITGRTIVRIGG